MEGTPAENRAAADAAVPPVEHRVRLRTGAIVGALECGPASELPPLVLVPGVGGAKELFATVLGPLGRARRVLAVDLSPRVARRSGVIASAVADLQEVLDSLGLERVDLLGQSFGAVVAVRAWRRCPRRVRRLVLAAPAAAPAGLAGARTLLKWLVLGGLVRVWPASRRESLARLVRRAGGYAIEPEIEGRGFDALVDRVKRLRLTALARRLLALAGHSWKRELADVGAPLLIVEGAGELALLTPGTAALFRTRPGARLAVLPGGHMPFLVRPEEFARPVRDFLDAPDPLGNSVEDAPCG